METLFQVIVLIFSVIVHEVSHGVVALAFGDPTAKMQGRLSLNPMRHIDWVGSVLLPLLLVLSKAGFIVGWAKPVPYNPYNLQNRRVAEVLIALAGPGSNLIIAIAFTFVMKIAILAGAAPLTISLIFTIVAINLILALFNLVPIPPLDGSKIVAFALPPRLQAVWLSYERYALIWLFVFLFFLWEPFYRFFLVCLELLKTLAY